MEDISFQNIRAVTYSHVHVCRTHVKGIVSTSHAMWLFSHRMSTDCIYISCHVVIFTSHVNGLYLHPMPCDCILISLTICYPYVIIEL